MSNKTGWLFIAVSVICLHSFLVTHEIYTFIFAVFFVFIAFLEMRYG